MRKRVAFFASDKPREQHLAHNFARGLRRHGDECVVFRSSEAVPRKGFDAVAMVGVKSKRLFDEVKATGAKPIMFDKGYVRSRREGERTWTYWRVSAGAHQPTDTSLVARKYPHDRFEALGLEIERWRRGGLQIVIAGSSAKYHAFYDLPDPTAYATGLVERIKQLTDRPIIYRPKPSWRDAVPIPGTRFSPGKEGIRAALANAHCLVTHGSNACFEAALLGIPSIVLGDAVARPISSTRLDEIEAPLMGKRTQWFANLAYHQFSEEEMRSGESWRTIRGWL